MILIDRASLLNDPEASKLISTAAMLDVAEQMIARGNHLKGEKRATPGLSISPDRTALFEVEYRARYVSIRFNSFREVLHQTPSPKKYTGIRSRRSSKEEQSSDVCTNCNGTGQEEVTGGLHRPIDFVKCSNCNGTGSISKS
jgi:DnaJ-class molecular chaperone